MTIVRNNEGNLHIGGVDRIQILPTSPYYNDELFEGYSELQKESLEYDENYLQFLGLLESEYSEIKAKNY